MFDDVSICSTHVYLLKCDKTDSFSACQPASVWPSATALDGKQKEQTKRLKRKKKKKKKEKKKKKGEKKKGGGAEGRRGGSMQLVDFGWS